MKIKPLLAILALLSIAAAAPITYTVGPSVFWRFQCDPSFSSSGEITSATVTAFYHATLVGSDGTVMPNPAADKSVPVNLLDTTKSVTVNGVTYTYAQIGQAFVAAANQEAALQSTQNIP